MAGIMLVLLFALGGAAVDFIRFTTLRAELQSAADSAVLAAASLSNDSPPVTVANEYFDVNFNAERFGLTADDVSFVPVVDQNSQFTKTISATATARLPTLFIRIIGLVGVNNFEKIDAVVNSQATEREQQLEISLVLDVSGSMAGAKIADLRSAADNFIVKILDESKPGFTSFSIVPFSHNVNLGPLFDTYANPVSFTAPAARECLFYEDTDFNLQNISGFRDAVLQVGGTLRDECLTPTILLNTDNPIALSNKVNSFTADGKTDAHIGLMWGLKALSPDLRGSLGGDFSDRPLNYGSQTLKTLVVMTDGDLNTLTNESGDQDIAAATMQFNGLCQEARDNGIVVFTIGFQITAGSPADDLLRNCASTISNYYFVEALDLDSAFEGIAASISKLRISE